MKTAGLALVALTLWAYSSVWTAAFVYEDRETMTYAHRGFTTWTWSIVDSPLGAHLLNLALLFLLTALILKVAERIGISGLGLWAIAGIWLVHPLNVETVAYAASRGELLAAIFVLTACWCALGRWWTPLVIAEIFGCLGLAVLSKESGVVGLLLVPFVIVWASPTRGRWIPAWLAALAIGAGVWWMGGLSAVVNIGSGSFADAHDVTWASWVGLQAAAAHHWLGSAIWMTGLTPDADIDAVPLIGRWISLGVLAGIAAGAVASWRRSPVTAFGLIWCLLALLPRFIVQTPQSYLNAHQFALPFVGLVLVAGAGAQRLESWWMA